LTDQLPEGVTAAVVEFLNGPLLENLQHVGRGLHSPLDGKWSARRGQYRVIYSIDDAENSVVVLQVSHRGDAYG